MTLTINESGDALAQTVDGITLPIDCSFEKVNGWIHGIEVSFEEVQALCLGMAAENDRLRAKLAAMEIQEPLFKAKEITTFPLTGSCTFAKTKYIQSEEGFPVYAKPAVEFPDGTVTEGFKVIPDLPHGFNHSAYNRHTGEWVYLNHANTWQLFQGPLTDRCPSNESEGE